MPPAPQLRWTALQTTDQAEFIAAASIASGGHEIYYPIETRKFVRRGIVKKIIWPFYPGYIFARVNIYDWPALSVLGELTGIIDFVRVGEAIGLIPDAHIKTVRDLENDQGEIPTAVATKFKAGDYVRVADGPFSSFSGRVGQTGEEWVEREASFGIKRIDLVQFAFVDVSLFGRTTPVKLFGDQLEPA